MAEEKCYTTLGDGHCVECMAVWDKDADQEVVELCDIHKAQGTRLAFAEEVCCKFRAIKHVMMTNYGWDSDWHALNRSLTAWQEHCAKG